MADETKRLAGTTDAGTMRRIGHFHMVVVPARSAKVVHINSVIVELEQVSQLLARAQTQVAALTAQRAQLEQRLAEFQAAKLDRVDGDPNVPLAAPEQEPRTPPPDAPAKPPAEAPPAEAEVSPVRP